MALSDVSKPYWIEVQRALQRHGFDPGEIDGERGAMTDAALIRFKRAKGLNPRPYIGPVTERALDASVTAPQANGDPSWINVARKYLGLREIPGPRDDPQIVAWWTLIGAGWFDDDETPWCGAFVGGVLKEDGKAILAPSLAPRARAWEDWGQSLDDGPAVGSIVTFWRGSRSSGSGHVAFVLGRQGDDLVCIGGNQSNAVTIQSFARNRVTSFRWPGGVARPNGGFGQLPHVNSMGLSVNEM